VDDSVVLVPRDSSAHKKDDSEAKRMNESETRLYYWAVCVDGRPYSYRQGYAFHSNNLVWDRFDQKQYRMHHDGSNFDVCYQIYLSGHIVSAIDLAMSAFKQNPVLRAYTLKQLILDHEPSVGDGKLGVKDLFRSLVSCIIRQRRSKGEQAKQEARILQGLLGKVQSTCGCSYQP
jgi:hypothetical protein